MGKSQNIHHCCLLHNKKRQKKMMMTSLSSSSQQKICKNKEEEKGAYLQTPTSTTTLKILLLLRSCYHHVEAPLVGALLKLLALEALVDFMFLKLRATQALSRSEALAMEVSAKGGGWGGGQKDEGGRWVGRKKGGRWVGVNRSFPKKKLGVKGAPKKK
jgi:hypothetical protein